VAADDPNRLDGTVRHLCLPVAGPITGQAIHVSGGRFFGGA
jgi:hypothetical protein